MFNWFSKRGKKDSTENSETVRKITGSSYEELVGQLQEGEILLAGLSLAPPTVVVIPQLDTVMVANAVTPVRIDSQEEYEHVSILKVFDILVGFYAAKVPPNQNPVTI